MKLSYKSQKRKEIQQERAFNPRYTKTFIVPANLGFSTWSAKELKDFASKLHISQSLRQLAFWNASVSSNRDINSKFRRSLLERVFPIREVATIRRLCGSSTNPRDWISPHNFRIFISLILTNASEEATNSIGDSGIAHNLGQALVSINETFSDSPMVLNGDPSRLLFAEQSIRRCGYQSDYRVIADLKMKSYLMEELLKLDGLESAFELKFGFSPTQFQASLLGLWAYFTNHTAEELPKDSVAELNFDYLMGQLNVSKAIGDHILKNYCVHLAEVPIKTSEGVDTDMSFVADHPLALYDGKVFCLDVEFLGSKVARELWNLGRAAAHEAGIKSFTAKAGECFENYCERYLKKIELVRSDHGAIVKSEKDLPSAKLDFLYVEGETAIAFECKSAPVWTTALYGDDPNLLAESLRKKFVIGSEGDKRGFKQIADHLEIILSRPNDFGVGHIKQFIPCLIVAEPAVTTCWCYDFVIHEGKELFEKFGEIVSDPVVIHFEDLEMIMNRSKDVSPIDVLPELTVGNLFGTFATNNYIHARWTKNPADFELLDPSLFHLERAIEHIRKTNIDSPTLPCPVCKKKMVTLWHDDSRMSWWCSKCSRSFGYLVAAEQKLVQDHQASMIARYRNS